MATAFACGRSGDARVHTGSRRVRGERRGGSRRGGVRRWARVHRPRRGLRRVRRVVGIRGDYASALHLNDLVTFPRRAAARRSSRWCTKKRVVVREGRAANDHWRLEDYVIDPIGFEVRRRPNLRTGIGSNPWRASVDERSAARHREVDVPREELLPRGG